MATAPSKVHTTMLVPKCVESVTFTYPVLTFKFTDGTSSLLNVSTWVFTENVTVLLA